MKKMILGVLFVVGFLSASIAGAATVTPTTNLLVQVDGSETAFAGKWNDALDSLSTDIDVIGFSLAAKGSAIASAISIKSSSSIYGVDLFVYKDTDSNGTFDTATDALVGQISSSISLVLNGAPSSYFLEIVRPLSNPLNSYAGNISANAVPVPGAVWLFGSALMGLVGFSRRKSSVVAA